MDEEIWKDIPNYEGIYQVSNLGRIKGLKRTRSRITGKLFTTRGRIMKPSIVKAGYAHISLNKDGIRKSTKVHKIVAETFLGHIPCGMNLVINHKDLNKQNNSVDNLEIVTPRENANRKHLKSSSKYVGVYWHKVTKKWAASISIKFKGNHLGLFTDELLAAKAYEEALKKISI